MNSDVIYCYSHPGQPSTGGQPAIGTRPILSGPASMLLHETKNPLCTIDLACDMLKLTGLDEEQQKCIEMIARNSHRIDRLVNTLLTDGGVGAEGYTLYPVRRLLEDVLSIVDDRILLKRISVKREFTAATDKVLVNVEKMKIALTNIVTDAIEAMDPGKGVLKIVAKSAGNGCTVEICDNGKGIDQAGIDRIFDPYSSKRPRGVGLDLQTTLDILQSNQVSVEILSGKGSGTSFVLSFGGGRVPV